MPPVFPSGKAHTPHLGVAGVEVMQQRVSGYAVSTARRSAPGCEKGIALKRKLFIPAGVIFSALLVTSCAKDPVFREFVEYRDPIGGGAAECVVRARSLKGDCEIQAREAYQQCTLNQRIQAEQALSVAMQGWNAEIASYTACASDARAQYAENRRMEQSMARDQFDREMSLFETESREYRNCVATTERNNARATESCVAARTGTTRRECEQRNPTVSDICGWQAPRRPVMQQVDAGFGGFDESRFCGERPPQPNVAQFQNLEICGSPTGQCDALFETVYTQECGGVVVREQRCVENCESLEEDS